MNATGEVFLSHTRINGAFVIRIAIGHLRTTAAHTGRAWELLSQHTAALSGSVRATAVVIELQHNSNSVSRLICGSAAGRGHFACTVAAAETVAAERRHGPVEEHRC